MVNVSGSSPTPSSSTVNPDVKNQALMDRVPLPTNHFALESTAIVLPLLASVDVLHISWG